MRASVFAPPRLPAAFTLCPPSLPNRSARTSPTPGNRQSFSTEANAAASVIKSCRKSTGGPAPARFPCGSSSSLPPPYRKRKSSKLYYRQPAYLLSTDLRHAAPQLLQIYFDRWQIEVNHRDEKDTIGVGQAQMWHPVSVPKQPALVVASYSALLLAALKAFGADRGPAFAALPKWRSSAKRPSCLDLITLLRKEAHQNPELLETLGFQISSDQMIAAAAA